MDELVKRLHKRIALTTAGSPLQDDLREAADAIEELSLTAESYKRSMEAWADEAANAKPRWIPATEALPEDGVRVLAYFRRNGYSAMNVAWCEQNDERIVWSNCQFIPTHWMPLPEPPEED